MVFFTPLRTPKPEEPDYTAHVKIDITTNGSEPIVAKDRVNEFFDRTFNEIEQSIRAAA